MHLISGIAIPAALLGTVLLLIAVFKEQARINNAMTVRWPLIFLLVVLAAAFMAAIIWVKSLLGFPH